MPIWGFIGPGASKKIRKTLRGMVSVSQMEMGKPVAENCRKPGVECHGERPHPFDACHAFGVLGTLSAVWVFVETVNAREQNMERIQIRPPWPCAVFMFGGLDFGGYWYLHYTQWKEALILKGPWPFAHNLFMETKEHLFLMTLILAFYLPIATRDRLYSNTAARRMVLSVAMLIVLTGLTIEGAGAVVDHGVKVALLRPAGVEGAK